MTRLRTPGLAALIRLAIPGLLCGWPVLAAEAPCSAATPPGVTCSCDVRTLRPLQGALGLEEVRDKARKITARPDRAWADLQDDPVKVVRGPGGALFITDHHHGADAWRLAGHPVALCQIAPRPLGTEAQFWSGLAADRLVRLADADGHPLTPAGLPASLEDMPDDPYRSLAWRLRKQGGYCRSDMPQKEFAEFVWADWLRTRPELSIGAVRASAEAVLPVALALARSDAASAVPGYVGATPTPSACASEP